MRYVHFRPGGGQSFRTPLPSPAYEPTRQPFSMSRQCSAVRRIGPRWRWSRTEPSCAGLREVVAAAAEKGAITARQTDALVRLVSTMMGVM